MSIFVLYLYRPAQLSLSRSFFVFPSFPAVDVRWLQTAGFLQWHTVARGDVNYSTGLQIDPVLELKDMPD